MRQWFGEDIQGNQDDPEQQESDSHHLLKKPPKRPGAGRGGDFRQELRKTDRHTDARVVQQGRGEPEQNVVHAGEEPKPPSDDYGKHERQQRQDRPQHGVPKRRARCLLYERRDAVRRRRLVAGSTGARHRGRVPDPHMRSV